MAREVQSFSARELRKRPFVIRIADQLTSSFGSIFFLIFNVLFFASWIGINLGKVPGIPIFDPFPFILLTMVVSLEAIILAIIVLMSQNRQNYIGTLREELGMQVDRIAEKEITKALLILKKLAEKQGIEIKDKELDEMLKDIELSYLERKLAEQLSDKPAHILREVEKIVVKVEKGILKK